MQRHRYLLIFLLCAGCAWAILTGRAAGPPPTFQIPDAAVIMDPSIIYPDAQRMADVKGTVTAILRAQGSYTFKGFHHRENDLIEQVSLDLTLTVRCTRIGNTEEITSTVSGTKIVTKDAPSYGWDPKIYHYGTGYWYVASLHEVEKTTYSGTETKRYSYPDHLSGVTWSKEQKLACFRITLGGPQSVGFFFPVKIHTERDTYRDEDHDHEASDFESSLFGTIPSRATSNSRFAGLVNNAGTAMAEMMGGWIETPSAQGSSNGSFTVPMFLDGLSWRTEGFYKQKGANPRQAPKSDNSIIWPGSLQVIWGIGNKLPEGRMTIAPEEKKDYDAWVPSPIDDEERYGPADRVSFTARIEPKEKGKPAPVGKIHFWLCDVSKEKGRCSNFPVNGSAGDDLRFAPNQAGLIVDKGNPRHVYTEKACNVASVQVEALDTGAYGVLQATCDDLGLIAEDDRTKLQSISIPLDDNHNHAADAWEKSLGIYGKNYLPTDDDDDRPATQRRKGDGYTFYEEYRGFMTLDKTAKNPNGFIRLDPRQKDLFVHDPDGLCKQWYEPYNPAQLELHYIDLSMMKYNGVARDPENRWVNNNSSEDKWYARQYAMFVKNWPVMEDPGSTVVGEASWHVLSDKINEVSDVYDDFKQPLKRFYMIKISQAAIEKLIRQGVRDPNVRQDAFRKMMTIAVIHEIGHGLGIHHHAEGMQHETDESVYGGVFECAMRYNSEAENQHPELMKWQTRYCKKGETWMKPGGGSAPAHNCFWQIDAKSDP